ncbi:hypothetical protein CHLRE_01g052050v5 [Chlamydomonas reinhardtii]|uniref:Ubiquinol-cytochrome c chaperone domain-containing protein n=1 Tax=Chlamydomonas reinhardtii TaxID=3055 RepID=A8HNJ6_CHLRE|nr:uncharacterized protein CHLRE_01g052050v5 [Chlamydomonas reinhardtii]PNW88958.1 hypothetical protein CHLRE_01g052050v5 [Chlamydomonas reinhardtii]|eukprot:XP_001689784.1 ubiquinol-cytochrome c oxidoreductase chaperone [Chlamydomonas reinhardtii]
MGRSGLNFRSFSSQSAPQGDRLSEVSEVLNAPPISLDFDRGEIPIPPDLDNALGRAMLKIMGFESKRSKLLHGAQRLYEAVTEQVDSGVLQRAFQTGKVFWSTYVLLSLYVWLVIHRLRDVRHADVKFFRQRFYNQFQQDVEFRVYAAGVQVGVTKWLKKLEEHFYETAFDFDKVLAPGASETLSDVILRKYYGGEETHRADADLLARFALREMASLSATDEEAVLRGNVRFSSTELAAALQRSGVTSAGESTAGAAAAGAATAGPGVGGAAPAATPAAEGGAGQGSG